MTKNSSNSTKFAWITDKYSSRLRCPRCKKRKIVDYGETFDCRNCELEFDKSEVLAAKSKEDLENILAIEEKQGILNAFKKEGESDEEFVRRFTFHNDEFFV